MQCNKNEKNDHRMKDQMISAASTSLPLSRLLKDFAAGEEEELVLPGLTKNQRKNLHNQARRLGLKSRSHGSEHDRILCITRQNAKISFSDAYKLIMQPNTRQTLFDMLPTMQAHFQKLAREFSHSRESCQQLRWRGEPYLTGLGTRVVPPRSGRISSQMYQDKKELPIFAYQEDILQLLKNHQVFIINGETGSGKSTQVPQYILQDATQQNHPCRIVVTQPRRIAAVSIAQRVAEERAETVGKTVGYQIRLENRMRRTSNLIYTTSGCLLRSIMANMDELFQNITHLIIDEIHERDKYTDFTLIALKKHLKRNRNLRVILMSATMNIVELSNYFDNCPVLNVPGQGFDVKIFHLEEILYYTGYRTNIMQRYYNSAEYYSDPFSNAANPLSTHEQRSELIDKQQQDTLDILLEKLAMLLSNEEILEVFDQIQYYIESEGMPADAAHSINGITPLMAACRANLPHYVKIFLQSQANTHKTDSNGASAFYYASLHADGHCTRLLEHYGQAQQQQPTQLTQELCEKQRLLQAYQAQFYDDTDVDHDLILSLLEGLYRSTHPGAIMVFLPGYNDIVQQRDLITSTFPAGTYRICIMHGQMDSQEQCAALRHSPVRKIILSTNIAQTSITIPDLAYIIDSGKVKMKTFDSITESSQLRSVWISQSDANQRAGRAGRTQNGICYRLYSLAKYQSMPKFCAPEFMRISLTEICLYAKTLEQQKGVQDFLSLALNPPSPISIRNAVKKLKILDVFDAGERITELGRHLVEIPLDVQLGKCLLFSIYLRCWEPVLTIVAFHSIKDPFILPTDRALQGQASFQRKALAGNSFSDQRGILELYNNYMALRHQRKKLRDFCAKYFLSPVSMELFCATRNQIRQLILRKFRLAHLPQQHFNWQMVRCCLVAGFYPNVAVLNRVKGVFTSGLENSLQLQRTSALMPPGMKNIKNFINTFPHDWLVFFEKAQLARSCFVNMNTIVPPLLVVLCCGHEQVFVEDQTATGSKELKAAPHLEMTEAAGTLAFSMDTLSLESSPAEGQALLQLDDWIKFEMLETDVHLLLTLRDILQAGFLSFLRHGHNNYTLSIAECLGRLLDTLEEQTAGTVDDT